MITKLKILANPLEKENWKTPDRLMKENKDLKAELISAKDRHKKTYADNKTLAQENKYMKQEMKDLKFEIEQLISEIKALKMYISGLKNPKQTLPR